MVVALAVVLHFTFPNEGAGFAKGYGTPVIAFEMAKTGADLEAVFGSPDDPQRAQRMQAMDAGNRWDYAFMVAYGGFIATFFLAVFQDDRRRIWWLFAAMGVVAALADGVENAILLGLTSDLAAAHHLEYLPYPVWIKFLSLMAAGLGAGWFLLQRHRGVWTALGPLVLASASTIALGFWAPTSYTGLMGSTLAIVWMVQWIYAWTRVLAKGAPH